MHYRYRSLARRKILFNIAKYNGYITQYTISEVCIFFFCSHRRDFVTRSTNHSPIAKTGRVRDVACSRISLAYTSLLCWYADSRGMLLCMKWSRHSPIPYWPANWHSCTLLFEFHVILVLQALPKTPVVEEGPADGEVKPVGSDKVLRI